MIGAQISKNRWQTFFRDLLAWKKEEWTAQEDVSPTEKPCAPSKLVESLPKEGTLHVASEKLEDFFHRMRSAGIHKAQEAIDTLCAEDPDHPLLEPVSLLAPMQRGTWEVAHTRILAWLLDGKQAHGFGNALLQSLLRRIAEDADANLNLSEIEVHGEFFCGTHDRIDLWITGQMQQREDRQPFLIAIEAKIAAEEGPNQLGRYDRGVDRWLQDHPGGKAMRVYLVSEIREAGEHWTQLLYQDLATSLWQGAQKKNAAPGYAYLRYYLASIYQDVCGWLTPLQAERNPYEVIRIVGNTPGQD